MSVLKCLHCKNNNEKVTTANVVQSAANYRIIHNEFSLTDLKNRSMDKIVAVNLITSVPENRQVE